MRSIAVLLFTSFSLNAVAEKVIVQCDLKKESQFEAEVIVPQNFRIVPASKEDRLQYNLLATLVHDDPFVLIIGGLEYTSKPEDNYVSRLYGKNSQGVHKLDDYEKKGFSIFNGEAYRYSVYSNAGYPIKMFQVPVVDGKISASGYFYYPGFDDIKNLTVCSFAPKQYR